MPLDYFRLDGHHIACDSDSPVFIDEETIGIYIGYMDSNNVEIYSGDIVQFDDYCKVLVWFCKELSCLTAINLDDDTYFNGFDYHNSKCSEDFCRFCVMLQDPYGDFQDKIKVIGNIFDNPELLKSVDTITYNSKCF